MTDINMPQSIQIVNRQDSRVHYDDKDEFALDVLVGLSETRKAIPSKYLYDAEGSRLFNKITELPEYYVTQCEIDSLNRNKDAIAQSVSESSFNLVEFGPGNGSKTRILLEHFLKLEQDFQYVPIDISLAAIEELAEDVGARFPDLHLTGLVSDYFTGIGWLSARQSRRNLVLFLGSNIGNFSHAKARFFLRNLWNCLNNGDIAIIGFDLKKDIELLLDAYNDSQGVTAAFNLNVLKRINRELGGDFDVSKFRHFGTYDVFSGAMESYLVSLEQQDVFVEAIGRSFTFRPWEPIHIEYSYKYLESDIDILAKETGFKVKEHLFDSKCAFVDSVWEVVKTNSKSQ